MAGYPKPVITGQAQQPRTVQVKAHTRVIAPKPVAVRANPNLAPLVPGSGITRGQAQRMANTAVTTRYGGAETGLGQQLSASQQLGVAQQGWYQQYLDALARFQQSTQDRATAANTATQQQADSLRTLDQGQLSAQQKAMAADAANRGATLDPSVAARASDASVVRQALEGGLGALIASQGRTAGDRASNLAQVVGPTQKLQAQAQNARQQDTIRQQQTTLKGQEGAFAQQFLDSLSQSESKNVLAASIASGRDLTQQTSINERVRHDKAQENLASTGQKTRAQADNAKVNQYGYTNQQWSHMTPAQRQTSIRQFKQNTALPKTRPGAKGLTRSQQNQVISDIKGAGAVARQLMSHPNANSTEVRQLLAAGFNPVTGKYDGKKYTHDEINAAFDLLPTGIGGRGGLSPVNVQVLRHMGVEPKGVFAILGPQPKSVKGTVVKPGVLTTGPGATFGNPGL